MHTTLALLVRKTEAKEHDRALEFLTPDFGRIEVVARGTRKISSKLNPHLQFLNLLSISFVRGPQKRVLVDAQTLDYFKHENYSAYESAFAIINFIDRLIWTELPEPYTFQLTSFALLAMKQTTSDSLSVLLQFKAKLIAALGYLPVFNRCARCGRGENLGRIFSFKDGGLVCRRCRSGLGLVAIEEPRVWGKAAKLISEPFLAWRADEVVKVRLERFVRSLADYFLPKLRSRERPSDKIVL